MTRDVQVLPLVSANLWLVVIPLRDLSILTFFAQIQGRPILLCLKLQIDIFAYFRLEA